MTAAAMTLHIRHADGSTTDLPVREEEEYIIGRKPGKTKPHQVPVILNDPFSSRSHCRIYRMKQTPEPMPFPDDADEESDATMLMGMAGPMTALTDGWFVEDLGSANGTILDRQSLIKAMPLPPNGVIRIGSSEITLIRPGDAPKSPPPRTAPVSASVPQIPQEEPEPIESLIAPIDLSPIPRFAPALPAAPRIASAPPPPGDSWRRPAPGAPSMAGELQKLAELRDLGILTDEEFQAQKRLLLGMPAPVAAPPPVVAAPKPPLPGHLPRVDDHGFVIEESGIPMFAVEAGTFSRSNIQEAHRRIAPLNLPILRRFINIHNTIFYLLHLGPFPTEEEAQKAAQILLEHKGLEELPGYGNCRVALMQELTRAEGRFDKRRPIQSGWPGIA